MKNVSYPTLDEVLEIHEMVVDATGGSSGIRDQALVEAAVHRPRQTFGGDDLYTTLWAKAAALFEYDHFESSLRRREQAYRRGRRPRISRA